MGLNVIAKQPLVGESESNGRIENVVRRVVRERRLTKNFMMMIQL